MSSFSGYLVGSPSPRDFMVDEFELLEPELTNGPTLTHANDRVFGINRWEQYELHTWAPLLDEVEHSSDGFRYQIYVVRGFAKMILLAQQRRIVEYAIAQIFDRRIFPNLRKISIFVDQMIEHCRRPESEFLVTSLHGRFAGPGTNLRSMSLYGDDVTQSPIYSEHYRLFNFHSSGLGRRLYDGVPRIVASDDGEIVRLATSGAVNLTLTTRSQALELTKVVNFVLRNRWVEEWVPGNKEDDSWPT